MEKLIQILLIGLLLSATAFGQEQKDFAYYNQLSYNQYMAGEWKALIRTGREAIGLGYDSYYLRMRMGIALYSMEKYRQAKVQFKEAVENDTESPVAKEYLYYSNLLIGNRQEAQTYFDIREHPRSKFFYSIYLEGGYKHNSSDQTNMGDLGYGTVGFKHQFSKRVDYFQTFQHLRRGIYTDGRGGGFQSSREDYITQNEYYGRLDILAAKGLWILPAFHYQKWSLSDIGGSDWLFSLGLVKDIGLTRWYADVNRSNLSNLVQLQVNAGMAFYPLGNLNLYMDGRIIYHKESSEQTMGGRYMLGGRISKTTWLEGWYTHGSMRHFSEQNGFIVFNGPNIVNSRLGTTLSQLLGKHMLYLTFIREDKTEIDTDIDFCHYDFIVGLNIKF